MAYLIAALAAPVAGPALYRVLHSHPHATRLLDGLVLLAVPTLVAWQVIAVAVEQRSLVVVVTVGLGLLVPETMERLSRVLERYTDDLAILVALSGILVHALLEGAAFAGADHVDAPFAMAVVVHRIPVGLVIWWLVRPRHGVGRAALAVGSIVLATLAGFGVGWEVLGDAHGPVIETYQAFVSGSLVHVVFHQGRHDHMHDHAHDHTHDHAHGE